MKNFCYFFLILLTPTFIYGQLSVNDSISIGVSYFNQSYYNMSNGEIKNVDNTNWDIAFDVSAFGSSIRTNGQTGILLYTYPNGDISNWSTTIDTSGISTWSALYNSDTSWHLGAFDRNMTSAPEDLGWGIYNPITHHVNGDSLFIIQLSNEQWKKLQITNLVSGTYNFKYANLDGSNEVTDMVTKSSYVGKNFVYYSLQTQAVMDREPNNTDWDIVFTKYVSELFPGIYYGVVGVLHNVGVKSSMVYPISSPSTYTNYSAHVMETEINTIGYDWKKFNMTTFQYDIRDSLCYFIKDLSEDVWRVIFTGFEGDSSGNISFTKELLATCVIENANQPVSFAIYPNPAITSINLVLDTKNNNNEISIFDLSGKLILKKRIEDAGFSSENLPIDNFKSGIYNISLKSEDSVVNKKLIIK